MTNITNLIESLRAENVCLTEDIDRFKAAIKDNNKKIRELMKMDRRIEELSSAKFCTESEETDEEYGTPIGLEC